VSDRLIPVGVVALLLIVLAIFAYTNLEIYPETVQQKPARHVRANNLFALETWLSKTGHPARTIKGGNAARILLAPEKTVFVRPAAFDWKGAAETLNPWMEAGGWLLVSTGPSRYEGEEFQTFLGSFGIAVERSDDAGTEKSEDGGTEPPSGGQPDFYPLIHLRLTEAAGEASTIIERWHDEQVIRLVQIPRGAGGLVVFGPPRFMENEYLEREVNARLAWDLTGARAGEEAPGLLIIRENAPVKSFFGRLADRGNFLPLGVSLLILIVLGFWAVIPGFGLVFQEKESPGRPIRERFRAELRFLKKYHALETYLELYLGEIKRKLRGREPEPELEAIEAALRKKGRLTSTRIVRALQNLETLMERL
jgi:hypothetical protein